MIARRAWLAAAVLGLLAPLVGRVAPAQAQGQVIERVVAVVNEDAIFLSELRRRAAPFLDRIMQAPSQAQQMAAIEQLYGELLERMIQEELFIQAAERMSVSVSRAEVDRAIGNVQRQSGLDDAGFWQAVAAQGFSESQYRSDVRRQLLRLKVLNQRARGRVNITEVQVRERYDMMVARARRQAQFSAAQIFVAIEGAGATDVAAARHEAERVRASIHSEEDFWALGGMDLGTLNQGDLPPELENGLMLLDPGQISSEPVHGPSGFHIFLLRERQQAAANLPAYDDVRMQVYQQMMEEAMSAQEASFQEELRRQAIVDTRL